MGNRGRPTPQQIMGVVPFTPMVKRLVIINVTVWLLLQVIAEPFILKSTYLTSHLGLVPIWVVERFFAWQPLTYMFVHSLNPMHILMNMLLLWWLGGELEQTWGGRFFLAYYLVSGVGAALIYMGGMVAYALVTSNFSPLNTTLVGASGGIFGLMTAYGIIFGDRVVYFFFVFPMKARYFVMILAAMETVMVLNNGVSGSDVSNLAHLGGLIAGFLFLMFWTRWKTYRGRRQTKLHGRKLKLVVNNDESKGPPRYWN